MKLQNTQASPTSCVRGTYLGSANEYEILVIDEVHVIEGAKSGKDTSESKTVFISHDVSEDNGSADRFISSCSWRQHTNNALGVNSCCRHSERMPATLQSTIVQSMNFVVKQLCYVHSSWLQNHSFVTHASLLKSL